MQHFGHDAFRSKDQGQVFLTKITRFLKRAPRASYFLGLLRSLRMRTVMRINTPV